MRAYSPVRRMNQQTKRLRFLGLLVFGVVVFLLLVVYRRYPSITPCESPFANVYDVVIDAGSTGSRVYIFQFERAQDGVVLVSERFRRVEPGLSSFADDPAGVRASVGSLLDLARETVPASHYACTAVTLKATAGLRLLPEPQQRVVLDAAAAVLGASPFISHGASLISGAQEGVYGWLTVNYLLGKMDTPATAVTVDMGGASAQVVFETDRAAGEWLPFNYAHQLRTPARAIALYQHSYLGLGLNEAKRTLTTAFAQVNGSAPFPCFPTGYAATHGELNVRNSGAADFDACAALFRHHVVRRPECKFSACGAHGVPQPALSAQPPDIYAFSYYYDRLHRFQEDDAPVSVASYREHGRTACQRESQPHDAATVTDTICMDMAYLYTFLSQGLGLDDATRLNVPNRIAGKAVSWSLGASLSRVLRME